SRPRHLSVAIDKFDYILPYSYLVGGVLSIRANQYKGANGYSNSYWGWGGEVLIISQPKTSKARYKAKQDAKVFPKENKIDLGSVVQNEFELIKKSIHKAYQSLNKPIEYCNSEDYKISENATIDIDQVLEEFGLDGLVEFYSNASLKYNLDIKNLNYSKPNQIDKTEFLELWNSTDINLLNTSLPVNSTDLIDYEGIELGGHW
ncbi:beta-1-4-N-acetylgalactosaminyltransferase bre-4-like, partial [Brachionus plicatilis]